MASAMAFSSRTINAEAIPFTCSSSSSSSPSPSSASSLFGDRLPARFPKNGPSFVSFVGLQTSCLNRKASASDKDGAAQLGFEPHLGPNPAFRTVQASAAIATAQQLQEEEILARFDRNLAKGGGSSKPGGISFPDSDGGFQKLGLDGLDVVNPRSDSEGAVVANLGLRDELVKALLSRGIAKLFPIQQAVFNPAMEGRDIIGRAKTGTGKTLAYGIPIIQHLLHEDGEGGLASRRASRSPRALVLAPTRELALQVEKEFLLTAPNLSIVCVYGGVPISSQQRKLARGIDVAVGTPGRIIDLIDRGSLDLKSVQFIVLDEADQMLAVGFEEDVEKILEELPPSHQSLLFSATLPIWVKKVSKKYLNRPLTIDLVGESDDKLAEGIKLYGVTVAGSAKRTVLNDIITVYGKGGKTIVFTQTKKDADDIALSLSRIHGCEALHGDIMQGQREKTLNAFRSGKFSVLVATDVAARGLDIPNVDLVIHFEIPNDPETFVHRSGRTGRAGKEGIAVLMQTPEQQRTVKMIERDTGCSFERVSPPSLHDVLNASSDQAEVALSKVHPDLKNMFLKTAERLIEEQGAEALAAAIAHLSGYTQPPPPRSLITHEQGFITLRVIRTQGAPLVSARRVMGALGEIHPEAVDNIGKILIMDEHNVSGAVFDMPEDYAKQLIAKINEMGPEKGLEVELCTKMPKVIDDGPPATDMYGRFSSRGGGRDRGRKPYGGGGGRYGDDRGDEFRNGRDSSRFSRGRPENSDAKFERRRSFSEGPFSGACYICGESGHKASFCPSGKQSSRRY